MFNADGNQMPISQQTVDLRFQPVNQQAPSSGAPVGRLAHMTNAVADQFEGPTLKTKQRKGFRQLTKSIVDPGPPISSTLTAFGGFPKPPKLLTSLEHQLLAVSDCHPYVLSENANEWARPSNVLHVNSPVQRPIYTSNTQIRTPDSAVIDDVVCYVWKEVDPAGRQKAFVMVRDLDGTVVKAPTYLGDVASPSFVQIKVVSDGTYFYVFTQAGSVMIVDVFNKTGVTLSTISFATLLTTTTTTHGKAHWDVQKNALGVCWYGATTTVNHALYKVVYTGIGPVTATLHNFTGLVTPAYSAYPFWLTNTIDATHAYVGIFGVFTADGSDTDALYVERINTSFAVSNETTQQIGISGNFMCGTSGYIEDNGDIVTFISNLDPFTNVDNVFNDTVRVQRSVAGALTSTETLNSVTVASRIFYLDGRPTSIFYFTDDEQPTFFLRDIRESRCVGMWSHGSSAQDWQGFPDVGSSNTTNMDSHHVPSPYVDSLGNVHCGIAYLAESFSKEVLTTTISSGAKFETISSSKFVSCVGLADVSWGAAGRAVEYADELMIPGPIATCFTGMIFTEDNFNLFPSNIKVALSNAGGGNLSYDSDYSIVVVFEWTDTRGNRVKGRPTAPIKFHTATQNIATITGATLFETEGKSNIMISVYSTYLISGVPSVDHRKVTDDLNPILNNKGSLTWTFIFNSTSAEIQIGEILYTDNGLLPHDPCPAFTSGCIAGNRMFVYGWDNALWYSDEKEEGQPLVFNLDIRRVLIPTSERVVSIEALDSMRIIILCEKSVWEFDISQLPGPDGLNGNVTSPKRLPFANGCNGLSTVVKEGILYTSNAGGIWLVSRGLENQQVSGPEYKDITAWPVIGMATDSKQRTFFGLQKTDHFTSVTRDGINMSWSNSTHPRKIVLVHSFDGAIVYCDDISVHRQDDSPTDVYLDDSTQVEVLSPIIQDITTEPINFGTIKGLKCVWKFILHGEYFGYHNLLVDATYETEDGTFSDSWTVTPNPANQYDYQFEPSVIEMSSITIRIRSDYAGDPISPSLAFELESISFEVGIDSYLNRTPVTRTPSSA